MTMPMRPGMPGKDPTQLARTIQSLEQRVKALEAVIRISGVNVEIQSQGKITVQAGANLDLKGALINLN